MRRCNWPGKRAALAWAAGLFEGEGCIYATHGRARLQIRMTDKDALERFMDIVECGRIYGPYYFTNPKWRPHYLWSIHTETLTRRVIAKLRPYLCERRTAKALEVFGEAHANLRRWSYKGRRYDKERLRGVLKPRGARDLRRLHDTSSRAA